MEHAFIQPIFEPYWQNYHKSITKKKAKTFTSTASQTEESSFEDDFYSEKSMSSILSLLHNNIQEKNVQCEFNDGNLNLKIIR